MAFHFDAVNKKMLYCLESSSTEWIKRVLQSLLFLRMSLADLHSGTAILEQIK